MKKKFSKLRKIDNNHKITKDTDSEAWNNLQLALLLALKEGGTLNETQCMNAVKELWAQKL